jgi:hypothetical protein
MRLGRKAQAPGGRLCVSCHWKKGMNRSMSHLPTFTITIWFINRSHQKIYLGHVSLKAYTTHLALEAVKAGLRYEVEEVY